MNALEIEASPYEREARLIYSIIVAGKSADFADKATKAFLDELHKFDGKRGKKKRLPFFICRWMNVPSIEECARRARTGNYSKLAKACYELGEKQFDLVTCQPHHLETIHGIGPKTSRFFIMWIRPLESYAALDVHVLRWMAALGYPNVPKATPQNWKEYSRLERAFIAEAHKRHITPRALDIQIWEAGAGRTQQTALPETTKTT